MTDRRSRHEFDQLLSFRRASDGEQWHEIPIRVTYEAYRGTTPENGPDPTSVEIIEAVITDSHWNPDTDLFPPDTEIHEVPGMVPEFDGTSLTESAYEDLIYSVGWAL